MPLPESFWDDPPVKPPACNHNDCGAINCAFDVGGNCTADLRVNPCPLDPDQPGTLRLKYPIQYIHATFTIDTPADLPLPNPNRNRDRFMADLKPSGPQFFEPSTVQTPADPGRTS